MNSIGKISRGQLDQLVTSQKGFADKKLVQGPAFGVDTSIIDLGNGQGLAVASDPVSFIPSLGIKESAWLSVHLMANDIATTGYLPQFVQFVLNLPLQMTDDQLSSYWHYIHSFCKEIKVSITGGHTGFDDIGRSTLAGGGTMFTIVDLSKVKTSAKAKPGQSLLMTKSAALSSTSVLAKSFPVYTKKALGIHAFKKLDSGFYSTSVLPEVKSLQGNENIFSKISAMHDITEGGVLGAVYELCAASGTGVRLIADKIPIEQETQAICDLFNIDPLRCVGAGSMLITCEPVCTEALIVHLNDSNIHASVIGSIKDQAEGKYMQYVGRKSELTYDEEDPYWDAFFNAVQQGFD